MKRKLRHRMWSAFRKSIVERGELAEPDLHRPPVREDMMHDEHEMMFLVGKLQQAHPEQRARIQFEGGLVNSSGNILGPPLSAVRRLTADVVKLDPGQLRAVDHLRRHFADQLEMSPNTLMPADDFVKTPFHVPDVEFADKFNDI